MIKSANPILDEDGRLSSASAATSLKYAKAKDLPSYPSAGLKLASAGAAASLADSNKRTFEHWKPGEIPAANRAALLAKDYEMDPLWQPELSAAGSKAALLAHRDPPQVQLPEVVASSEGQSAAGQALRNKTVVKPLSGGVSADERKKALMAATGAMSGNRPRAGSSPAVQQSDARSWALKAATKSHRDSPASQPFASGDPGFEAARIQNLAKQNVDRQMFGSAPPVSIEVEERKRQDTLRASAVAMAQKMYAVQQARGTDTSSISQSGSRAAATNSHRRTTSDVSTDGADVKPGPRYENLEEAARKLAQERLAKIHDEHAEYRSYYGASSPPQKSRLSLRMRARRASTGNDSDSDEEQSRRIRQQMSLFTNKLAEVDKNKRQADRDKLLEVAHRNVEARMNKMDEQVFQSTGKASPAQRELWERQARERAQKQVDLALQNVGKVHIGGGHYLEKEEVDAIAKARLQPTLDEISDKAEKQRARDAEIKLDQERAAADLATKKARDADVKAELKSAHEREKQEAKAKRDEEKRVQQVEKEAEKERARLEKDERRKSKDTKPGRFSSILRRKSIVTSPATDNVEVQREAQQSTVDAAPTPVPAAAAAPSPVAATTVHHQVTTTPAVVSHQGDLATDDTVPTVPVPARGTSDDALSPSKRDSRVKSWLKSHLRNPSKAQKEDSAAVGVHDPESSRDGSLRDVAMAGRAAEVHDGHHTKAAAPISPVAGAGNTFDRSPSISSLSSSEAPEQTMDQEADAADDTGANGKAKGLKTKLLSKIRPNKGGDEPASLNKTTTTEDEFEEARDTFEEKLSPPNLDAGDRPRSSHEASRFKEEL